ncbi:unnamed protein product, partial [Mesorhabditis belari]|uniref:Surfeit locus protein 4 n=1 Tax=Mesorhabditis belari TaxID=2138241 RepID=A0AAF3F585_9BILA
MNHFRLDEREKKWLSKAEDLTDDFIRHTRHVLPVLARLCLVSTFFEDGCRMFQQWSDQVAFYQESWYIPPILGHLLVIHGVFGQIGSVCMILARKKIPWSVAVLGSVVLSQTILYRIFWEPKFLLRNVSIAGALIFLAAETFKEPESLFAGLPSGGDENNLRCMLMLVGRCCLALMYLTMIKFEFSLYRMLNLFISFGLMSCVIVGYRTRLMALVVAIFFFVINFYDNAWWTVPNDSNRFYRDFMKYDFFQALSVIGGLLLVIAYGPGGVSYDDFKKQW